MIELDTKEFQTAMKQLMMATDHSAKEIVDFGMGNTLIHASKETKKTTAAEITADLERNVTGKDGRSGPRKYLLVNARHRNRGGSQASRTQRQVGVEARRLVNARRKTAGYLLICIRMAAKPFGLFKNVRAGRGWAANSKGTPADWRLTVAESKAEIWLPKGAASKVNLQKAINSATATMMARANKAMGKNMDKHSSK